MKRKTSVTLSESVLQQMDEVGVSFKNRSDFIEQALVFFMKDYLKTKREKQDLEILNRNAEKLNEEAMDVLSYQVDL